MLPSLGLGIWGGPFCAGLDDYFTGSFSLTSLYKIIDILNGNSLVINVPISFFLRNNLETKAANLRL